jgi:3-oxoadipate enol-lactonase
MKDYADDVASLMDCICWSSENIIGSSFGGMVGQEIAVRYTEKVKKLVLCCSSSGGKGGAQYPIDELLELPMKERVDRLIELVDNRCNEEWRNTNHDEYRKAFEHWEKFYNSRSADPETTIGAMHQLEARMSHDTYDRLHTIRCPVLICGGKYDGLASPENQRNLHERIPHSRLELFEGGHNFLGQDPKAYRKIIKFLKI